MTRLLLGDCLEVLRELEDNSVDSVVTDPPYGLSFMGKKWDYDVPSEDVWRECLRVLKPGGHLLAFAGTRTQHRMAVRIEDAGFEIRDMIAWTYGSGFPKSMDVSKAIDKDAGHWRGRAGSVVGGNGAMSGGNYERTPKGDPITEAARQWAGWGTALKPALEPITVARKPLGGTVAANVLQHGTGALNIDGCRVGTDGGTAKGSKPDGAGNGIYGAGLHGACEIKQLDAGRWPANLIHDGSEPADLLGEAARFFYCAKTSKKDRNLGLDGTLTVKYTTGLCKEENMDLVASLRKVMSESTVKWGIDESGASITGLCQRDSLSTTLTEISKITTSQICSLLTRLHTKESIADVKCETESGGSHVESAETGDPLKEDITNEKMGSVHGVSHVVSEMLLSISNAENWKPMTNIHSTVKPTELMRYLCRLVTPPGGVVLDPFMGSGSTGKAAMLEGFQFIGIEREEEYMKIAEARINAACS